MSIAADVVFPPSGSAVVLEGGYYTLRPYPWKGDVLEGPRSFYFEVTAGTPPLAFEVYRRPVENEVNREWVVLTLPEGERVSLPDQLSMSHIMTFDPPTATELHSFNKAVSVAEKLRRNENRVSFALLVGDLALPRELRQPITWVLPESYKEILAESKGTVLMTESRCRSVASKKIIRTARRALKSADVLAQHYGEAGYCVFEDPSADEHTLYLAADALLDGRFTGNPVIALTKGETRPACAATIAGKLHALLKRQKRLTYHIAWYDTADDPDIRKKNLEALIVAASFFGDIDVDAQVVTLDNGRVTHIDRMTTAQVRKHGLRRSHQELLMATYREGRHYGLDFVLSGSSADCCVYRRNGDAVQER